MLRSIFVASYFFSMTPLLIAAQWAFARLRLPGRGTIAVVYYKALCRVLGLRVRVIGVPITEHPVLMVSNHQSWADILALGSITSVAFVSKREVRDWPIVGISAELLHTVFVDRTRRHQTGAAIADMVERLAARIPVVLFAEGTSSDGNRVLPFRSALIGALRDACAHADIGDRVMIQPVSICYTSVQGLPMGRQHRPVVAWYGDLDLTPHLKTFLERGAVDVVVTFGEPIPADGSSDRKNVTRMLEMTVRRLTAATLRSRAVPAAQPAE
ncbi:MAG TPA: lysophospholipid acyltransferase family protein [Pseudolabrys sp.]|nr:lysophospholipid acyltransferase family protein [Pseudolabrys sp.]